VTVEAASRW